jgi:hypothetical protein
MIGTILQAILGFFAGDAGAKVGSTVANGAAIAAVLAAVTPIALWFLGHKDDTFITVTYGEAAFWFGLFFGLVVVVVKVAHWSRPPGQ